MFIEKELNSFFRYCMALTGNEEEGYDLLQTSLEKFVRKSRWQRITHSSAYLHKIIRNQFFDNCRQVFHDEVNLEEVVIPINDPTFDDLLIEREEIGLVLESLTPAERELLFLWAVEGYTFQEIAKVLGVPRGTLLARIHRMRIKIGEGKKQFKIAR